MRNVLFTVALVVATFVSANAQFYAGGSLGFESNSELNKLTEVVGTEYKIREPNSFIKGLHTGIGIGPETCLSLFLPKVSYYNFQGHKHFDTYYGIESTIGFLVAQWFSFDCLYGVKKNIFTFDASIGAWWYPRQKFDKVVGPYFHSTINPKIGIKFWQLWFKIGPSIFLYQHYPKNQELLSAMDFGKIGNVYFNFEILVNFKK